LPERFIGHGAQRTQWMVRRYALLGAYVAKHIQLLIVFSAHIFFLSA
jgi:hypothetical protein